MSDAALQNYLSPLADFFADDRVEEVVLNRPGEVFVERAGAWSVHEIEAFNLRRLNQLAELTATFTQQRVTSQSPLLSAYLPGGQRIQVIMPPACPPSMFGLAIRQPARRAITLDRMSEQGALNWRRGAGDAMGGRGEAQRARDEGLAAALDQGNLEGFLRLAVRQRRNIVISGGTSTGKTTVMRALTEEIAAHERIITIEDVREIQLTQPNRLHLLASKGGQGVANVTVSSLLEACLRLRPDRILLGEMRGVEAADFLELVNTGHPGSISTVHADSPRLCFERIALMVKRREGFQALPHEALVDYIKSVVDVIVQFRKTDTGLRALSDVWVAPRILDGNSVP